MPRKKTAHVEKPEEVLVEDEIEFEEEQAEEKAPARNGGLDVYDENGELLEPGEPSFFEDDEADED
jgi:hypothetical protein